MPVEIRELVIKATIAQESSANTQQGSSSGNEGSTNIVKVCVEKVLEILKEKNER